MASGNPADRLARLAHTVRDGGVSYSRLRMLVRNTPVEDVVEIAEPLLRSASSAPQFERAARAIAWTEDAVAVSRLAVVVRDQRRFPRIAVRALAGSELPEVEGLLVDLMTTGRYDQRSAAVHALARRRSALAVGPLCDETRSGRRRQARAFAELQRLGSAVQVADLVLGDARIDTAECARVLAAIPPVTRVVLLRQRYEPEAFLERVLRVGSDRVDPGRVRAVLDLVRARKTLGRPAPAVDNDTLLRAARSGETPENRLLRASDGAASGDADDSAAPPASPLSRLLSALRLFRRS